MAVPWKAEHGIHSVNVQPSYPHSSVPPSSFSCPQAAPASLFSASLPQAFSYPFRCLPLLGQELRCWSAPRGNPLGRFRERGLLSFCLSSFWPPTERDMRRISFPHSMSTTFQAQPPPFFLSSPRNPCSFSQPITFFILSNYRSPGWGDWPGLALNFLQLRTIKTP